jgi:hypothetical protein
MPGWATVREVASALPGAEESTTYGQPAFKVGGKLFAWLSPVPALRRAPDLLVHLERADRRQLEERIEESWLLRAGKRLADAYVSQDE